MQFCDAQQHVPECSALEHAVVCTLHPLHVDMDPVRHSHRRIEIRDLRVSTLGGTGTWPAPWDRHEMPTPICLCSELQCLACLHVAHQLVLWRVHKEQGRGVAELPCAARYTRIVSAAQRGLHKTAVPRVFVKQRHDVINSVLVSMTTRTTSTARSMCDAIRASSSGMPP